MRNKRGKGFNSREVAATKDGKPAQGNQWQASEKQLLWLNYYMNPREKETYANAYEAAIKAGYNMHYAQKIMSPSLALQWVQSAKTIMRSMNTEHLRSQLEEIVTSEYASNKDKIAAIKLLGIDQGMFVQKQITAHVGLEQALEGLE